MWSVDVSRNPLPRTFYGRDTLTVARDLLGKNLGRSTDAGQIVAKIVEVEAYRGSDDPASHAYRKKTQRNQLMFEKAGIAYVYFIYGNHYCLNVTTEGEGIPGAVLIRAIEIVEGLEIAQMNRKTRTRANLTNGPGKLTQALAISKAQNGLDLTLQEELFIYHAETVDDFEIVTDQRVGITAGREKPWRFYISGNKFVSKQRF